MDASSFSKLLRETRDDIWTLALDMPDAYRTQRLERRNKSGSYYDQLTDPSSTHEKTQDSDEEIRDSDEGSPDSDVIFWANWARCPWTTPDPGKISSLLAITRTCRQIRQEEPSVISTADKAQQGKILSGRMNLSLPRIEEHTERRNREIGRRMPDLQWEYKRARDVMLIAVGIRVDEEDGCFGLDNLRL